MRSHWATTVFGGRTGVAYWPWKRTGVVLMALVVACTPVTPPRTPPPTPVQAPSTPAPTPPAFSPFLPFEVPDGTGTARLLFTPDVEWVAPPKRVRTYRATVTFAPRAANLQRWGQQLGWGTLWTGMSPQDATTVAALTEAGHALIATPEGLTYRRLWGAPPPEPRFLAPETSLRSFLSVFPPAVERPVLHRTAQAGQNVYYQAFPLVDGLPLLSDRPWAEGAVTVDGYLRWARVMPFSLTPTFEGPSRPFGDLVPALQAGTLAPLAVVQPADAASAIPLAKRPTDLRWETGVTVTLTGEMWVLRGGQDGAETRAWVIRHDAALEIASPEADMASWTFGARVTVEGTLVAVDPVARWGRLQVTQMRPAPALRAYEGTLAQGPDGTLILRAPEGPIPLPDVPPPVPVGLRVRVVGYRAGQTFVWERLYPAPAPDRRTRERISLETVVRVEPVYWLTWSASDTSNLPLEGLVRPAWRVVTTAGSGQVIILYYPMTE